MENKFDETKERKKKKIIGKNILLMVSVFIDGERSSTISMNTNDAMPHY